MKTAILYGLLCFICFPAVLRAEQPARYLLVGGSGNDKVSLIDKKNYKELWSYSIGSDMECNSLDITPAGDVLIAYRSGAKLVNPENNTVIWDVKAPGNNELSTASVLPDGGFLLAWSGSPASILELDVNGKVRKEVTFDTGIEHLHGQFRQVVKSRKGNYLVPLMGKGTLIEINDKGEVLSSIKTGGNPFSAVELKDGTIIVPCGDAHCIKWYNKGNEINKLEGQDIPGISLQFVAGITTCRNGNLLICNWLGHGTDKTQPLIIETGPDGKLVWTLPSDKGIGSVSAAKEVTKEMLKQKHLLK